MRCFDKAASFTKKCHYAHKKSVLRIIYYYIVVLIIFLTKTITSLQHRNVDTGLFLLYSITYIVPLVMEGLVIYLCTVVGDTCRKINEILDALIEREYNDVLLTWNLKKLMKIHQDACSFFRAISACFDKDLLVDLAFNMVWFVIYIYIITVSLWKMKDYTHEFWKVSSVVLEVLFLTFRVCFLSYSVNSIDTEVRVSVIHFLNRQ